MCSNEFFSKDAMWKILEAGVCCSRRDVLRWKHENLCLLAYKVRFFLHTLAFTGFRDSSCWVFEM